MVNETQRQATDVSSQNVSSECLVRGNASSVTNVSSGNVSPEFVVRGYCVLRECVVRMRRQHQYYINVDSQVAGALQIYIYIYFCSYLYIHKFLNYNILWLNF